MTQRGGTPPAALRARLRADSRLQTAGWVLLPLRAFLGVTFVYAGASKILDPHYLDPGSPLGVRSQMLHAAVTSPLGGLVSLSAGHATETGLLIAFAELAVGVGALLGLLTRLAALGGVLLALSFFLTVSWTTRPYYTGADLVFAFAWTPLLVAGDGGVFALTDVIRAGIRRDLGLPPVPTSKETVATRDEVERRTVVRGAVLGGAVAAVTVLGGTLLALGRRTTTALAPSGQALTPSGQALTPAVTPTPSAAGGQQIAAASDVQVGTAKSFTAANGDPAYLLHPDASTFVAFSAVCTHQGCPVSFVAPGFQCPCHGASYDQNGQVTGGPAPAPLTPIPVKVVGGQVVAG